MDSWLKSFFGGLVLVAVTIGALWLFNLYEGQLVPYIRPLIGIDYPLFVGLLILVFIVGFAATPKAETETYQDYIARPNKLFTTPNSRVKPSFEPDEVEQIELVQDAYIAYLQDRIAKLDEDQAIVLKIKLHPPSKMDFHFLGKTVPLQRDVVLYYLEHLKKFPNFRHVVFVDWFNRFVFFIKAEEFRKEIEPISGTHLIDLMNANRIKELSDIGLFNASAVTNHASNLKTLKYMAHREISEVMVVTHTWGRRFVGVAEITKLLNQMLAPKKPPKKKKKAKPSAHPVYDDGREEPILMQEDADHTDHDDHVIHSDDTRREPTLSSGSIFDDDRR